MWGARFKRLSLKQRTAKNFLIWICEIELQIKWLVYINVKLLCCDRLQVVPRRKAYSNLNFKVPRTQISILWYPLRCCAKWSFLKNALSPTYLVQYLQGNPPPPFAVEKSCICRLRQSIREKVAWQAHLCAAWLVALAWFFSAKFVPKLVWHSLQVLSGARGRWMNSELFSFFLLLFGPSTSVWRWRFNWLSEEGILFLDKEFKVESNPALSTLDSVFLQWY